MTDDLDETQHTAIVRDERYTTLERMAKKLKLKVSTLETWIREDGLNTQWAFGRKWVMEKEIQKSFRVRTQQATLRRMQKKYRDHGDA